MSKKRIDYAESSDGEEDEDGDELFRPLSTNPTTRRASKRRKIAYDESDDDEFAIDDGMEAALIDEGKSLTDPRPCYSLHETH